MWVPFTPKFKYLGAFYIQNEAFGCFSNEIKHLDAFHTQNEALITWSFLNFLGM